MAEKPEKQEEMIFYQALEKGPTGRETYLKEACGDNHELYNRVDALLQAYDTDDNLHHVPIANSQVTFDNSLNLEGPGSIIGRYKLLEKIGEGGFGVVWAAEQKKPVKRRVALKIIKLGMDTRQVIARFEAERQALAMMDHPNIAKVLDAGSTDTGRPYFVMELVRGIPIIEYCDQVKLSIQDRLDLFIKVCNAIQHAHQKGIIHRDIKPSNILITLHDGIPVPRIIDFGIAKATQQELTEMTIYTQHNQFIGTPAYMSPEQAEMSGLDIDTRSDIYSLGVLLYELLTGRTPFDEKELMQSGIDQMRKIIREKEPQKPSTKFATLQAEEQSTAATRHSTDSPRLISLIRGDLDWVVMKCLEKDRTRRYDTANGLALDVVRHMNNEPVIARPPSTVYRFQKAWRRNKVVYTAACMVVVSLIVGISLSVWQAWIATGARKDAEAAGEREYKQRLQSDTDRERAVQEERRAKEGERKQRLIAYASDMRVAQEYLRENNLGKVAELLNRYMSKPGQEDLRGIEWRYLWQASKGDEIHTFPHESWVNSISLSADGTRLASISVSGKIRLFDVDSRTQLREYKQERMILAPQDGLVALSPNGSLLAAVQHWNDGTLKVWNADNGALIFEQKNVKAPVGFSPDSQSLAATTKAGLRIWNTADWTSRSMGESLVTGFSPSLTFTPDSSRVLFSPRHNASKLMVYNLADNTTEGELAVISAVDAISTDGSIVAAGGWGGKVCVWDLASRSVIKKFQAHIYLAVGVALSPDGKTLATAGNDQLIRFWDTKTFENTRSLKGHLNEIWDLKFSSDGRILASAGKDDSVKLWDLMAQPDPESEYSVPKALSCRGFSQSGDALRFQDPNEWNPNEAPRIRTDHLLDLTTGQWNRVIRSDSEALAQFTSMMWESDQDTYLFGKADGTVVLSDGTTTQSIQVTDHPVVPLLLSPKRRYLLLNVLPKNAEPYAILWDLETEEIVGQYPKIGNRSRPTKQAISPDERFLAYYSDNDFTVKLWQIPENREWATLRGHRWDLCGVEFSPDSHLLASFSLDGSCRLWDVEKGEKANPHLFQGHRSGVEQAVFSSDGRTLATTSNESYTIKLWSVATGQEMLSLSAPRVHGFPIIAAKADRLVWARDSGQPPGTLRVTTLPSLVEIDEDIRRQSSAEILLGSGDGLK